MTREVTLYYANWCGHCQKFKPEWEVLKSTLDKFNISHHEYEDSQDSAIIAKENVQGFPTIRIKENGKEYEYTGPRQATEILHSLNVLPDIDNKADVAKFSAQLGGDPYVYKLQKYKHKYETLYKWAKENNYV